MGGGMKSHDFRSRSRFIDRFTRVIQPTSVQANPLITYFVVAQESISDLCHTVSTIRRKRFIIQQSCVSALLLLLLLLWDVLWASSQWCPHIYLHSYPSLISFIRRRLFADIAAATHLW